MITDFKTAKEYVEKEKIRMLDLKWCDYSGRWHHITISTAAFIPHTMKNGVGFDGSSVGFKPVSSGDMVLIPDLSTAFIDPFFEETTLSFIADIHESESKQQFALDPREIVRRAEKYLQSIGLATHSLWGPEFEFFIFDKAEFHNQLNSAGYYLYNLESDWEELEEGQAYQVPKHEGYHRIPPSDRYFEIRNMASILLEDVGVPVKYHHHEAGGPGHNEIEPPMLTMLKAADAALLVKYIVKNVAFQEGLTATFLPKPLFGEAGNGMHCHQLLMKAKSNIFYDGQGYAGLSQAALYYIGGLLKHAPALTALTNPSTNSYRRLMPGYEAPVNCFFGRGDRSAAIRIPKYAVEPEDVRLEYRPPDATANPYLALPAMLLAGLDGIQNKIDPAKNGFGPFEEDVFHWTEEQRSRIKSLPANLEEAANCLRQDHDFLLKGEVFTQDFLDYWIDLKIREHKDLQARPHPHEIEKYYDA